MDSVFPSSPAFHNPVPDILPAPPPHENFQFSVDAFGRVFHYTTPPSPTGRSSTESVFNVVDDNHRIRLCSGTLHFLNGNPNYFIFGKFLD